MNIIGTGLSGLIGSKLVELCRTDHAFTNLDLSAGIDITDAVHVRQAMEGKKADVVVHFAAFTDVSKAHEEQGDKAGIVYKVNVQGTSTIAKASAAYGLHLIHISTAYVFDGNKADPYTEADRMSPIEWYGQTKAWAEEEVEKSGCSYTILRIDQPYQMDEFPKLDILHRIKKGLEDGSLPPMFTNHTFTPTNVEMFVEWMKKIMKHRPMGIFNATTDETTTDYEFACWVKKKFSLNGEIKPGDIYEYIKNAPRPYQINTALDQSKILAFLATV